MIYIDGCEASQQGSTKMAQSDLDRSLTAMDWLPRLSVGGALGNATAVGRADASKLTVGHTAMRKAPNSPLDTTAMLDCDSHQQQKDGKPPYSYANLITFAINSSSKKKMTLSEIYQWICENFPYYKDAGNGWKVGGFRTLPVQAKWNQRTTSGLWPRFTKTLNPCRAEFILRITAIYSHFLSCPNSNMTQVSIPIPHGSQGPIYPALSIYCCWWPGDARSQAISNNGIDTVALEQSISPPEGWTDENQNLLTGLFGFIKIFQICWF